MESGIGPEGRGEVIEPQPEAPCPSVPVTYDRYGPHFSSSGTFFLSFPLVSILGEELWFLKRQRARPCV